MKPAKTTKAKPTVSGDWFYMNANETTVREIYDVVHANFQYDTEIWEAAGVMEINLTDKSSLDFEMIKPAFRDEEGAAFLSKHDIHALFTVTFSPEMYDQAVLIMKKITEALQGFFCEDTIEFDNIIK